MQVLQQHLQQGYQWCTTTTATAPFLLPAPVLVMLSQASHAQGSSSSTLQTHVPGPAPPAWGQLLLH
jgi:hypothetical protein